VQVTPESTVVQLTVAITVVSLCNEKVQMEALFVHPPLHPPNEEAPTGVAVRVTGVPLAKLALHVVPWLLAQLIPRGELVSMPVPLPGKLTVRIADPPPEPVLVKQTTFAVMDPVTMAPDEDSPPSAAICGHRGRD
jgi:hypothetical protein